MRVRVSPLVVGIVLCALQAGIPVNAKTGITVKLTGLDSRYPGNQPGDFEAEIRRLVADPHHPQGQRYAKVTVVDDKPAMPVMSLEYADARAWLATEATGRARHDG